GDGDEARPCGQVVAHHHVGGVARSNVVDGDGVGDVVPRRHRVRRAGLEGRKVGQGGDGGVLRRREVAAVWVARRRLDGGRVREHGARRGGGQDARREVEGRAAQAH